MLYMWFMLNRARTRYSFNLSPTSILTAPGWNVLPSHTHTHTAWNPCKQTTQRVKSTKHKTINMLSSRIKLKILNHSLSSDCTMKYSFFNPSAQTKTCLTVLHYSTAADSKGTTHTHTHLTWDKQNKVHVSAAVSPPPTKPLTAKANHLS